MVKDEDISQILAIYAPYILSTSTSFETEVPSLSAFTKRINKVLKEAPWLVCTYGDQIAGYAYATDHRSRQAYQYNRELSVYVADHFHKKGIGSALYFSIIEILKKQGYANVLAGITLPNDKSIAFHQSIGFTKVGTYHRIGFKFGRYIDVSWWEMKIRKADPDHLLHFEQLDQDALKSCFKKGMELIKRE